MELVKVENGNSVVSARDLHTFLEVGADFTNWCKRMFEYGFVENQDYSLAKIGEGKAHNKTDYALTIDCAKEISMLQRTNKGKQARQYFIDCEKNLKANQLPTTYLDAIKALVVKEEQKLLLENKVENLSTALDCLVEWSSILKAAQFNKISEKVFNWRKLKDKSNDLGFEVKKVPSGRFAYQNLYHVNAFKACYPEYNYNFPKD